MLKRVHTTPDVYEPFLLSQGIRLGDILYISGQAGYADDGRIVAGGFRAQGERAFFNLRRALEAGGSGLQHVAKVTIFLDGNESISLAQSFAALKGLFPPERPREVKQ